MIDVATRPAAAGTWRRIPARLLFVLAVGAVPRLRRRAGGCDAAALDLAPARRTAATSFPAETRYFRKAFAVKEPSRLVLEATADNSFTLYLDGKEVAAGV